MKKLFGDVLTVDDGEDRASDDEMDVETIRMSLLKGDQFLRQDDIGFGLVRVDELHLRLVAWISKELGDDLIGGSNTGSTDNKGDVLVLVGLDIDLLEGTLHLNTGLACLQGIEVTGQLTTGICLDDEIERPFLVLCGNRRVWLGRIF